MTKDIKVIYIPKDNKGNYIASLNAPKITLNDMAECTIDVDVTMERNQKPDFSKDWVLEYSNTKYVMAEREPQGLKNNESKQTSFPLTFQHWAILQLKRWLFVTIQPLESGTAVADQYNASVNVNLKEMCELFNQVLNFYFGNTISIKLNPQWVYDIEPQTVEINNSYLWDVLIQFYDLWAVRWSIEADEDIDHYVIKVGYDASNVDKQLKYGFEGGLLSVERQPENKDIKNLLLGRGGEKNLPARYFKDTDPDNPSFAADPDWIPELRNIYFDRLHGKTFRDYIKGWKTNPRRQLKEADGTPIIPYPHDETVKPIAVELYDETYAKENWAYFKGHTDEVFRPIEYVANSYEVVDLKEIQAVEGSSIYRHGEMLGGLEDNDDIYPTIQGVEIPPLGRADEAVWVEEVTSDDYEQAVSETAQTEDLVYTPYSETSFEPGTRVIGENLGDRVGVYFEVKQGNAANITYNAAVSAYLPNNHEDMSKYVQILETQISVYDANNPSKPLPPSGIPAGKYFFIAKFKVENTYKSKLNITCALNEVKLQQADAPDTWRDTFDILIKNIWGTTQKSGESDAEYAERVWTDILGDKLGNEAKIVFADGMLAVSDYEFIITKIPKVDRQLCGWVNNAYGSTQTYSFMSEWRLTLAKSDADLKTLNKYVPNKTCNGKAGDHFYFIGIDMPHRYTLWAEARLDDYKTDQFANVAEANPSYNITTDRVKVNNYGLPGGLIEQFKPGASVTLFDEQLVEGGTQPLYISGVTITYREPTSNDPALNPDVELTLTKEYSISANPVSTIQGEISAISKQIGSISNIQQIVRAIGDRLYLRKDAVPDSSLSPTQFYSLVTSGNFRAGMIGGAGWGFYQDVSGRWVLETDKLNVRQQMQVNDLVVNQISARGGMIVESAAAMEITNVVYTDEADYECYFDTKQGTVANLFKEDDIVLCHRFTPENGELKYYRRVVYKVYSDHILLSGDIQEGGGTPEEGDVIVQFGNESDINRQFVIVRDVIGGGYERFIEGLDSCYADGKEYVFIGKQDNQGARFFVGDKDSGYYLEYVNGKLTISGELQILGTNVVDYIKSEIDDLQVNVGGTNLYLGSQDWNSQYWENTLLRISPDSFENPQYYQNTLIADLINMYTPIQLINDFLIGEEYTISVWVKNMAKEQTMKFCFLFKNGINAAITPVDVSEQLVTGQWVRVKHTFKLPAISDFNVGFQFGKYSKSGGYVYIAGMKIEKGNVATDWSKNPDDNSNRFEYLRKAMQEDTNISGGLIQTSTILLGQTEADGSHTTWAGSSGLFTNTLSPALWAGGDMADAQYNTDNNSRPAKFMVRMDGTGYAAGNTIQFTESQMRVGNNTVMDANGFYTIGGDNNREIVRIANIDLPQIEELLSPTNYNIRTRQFLTLRYFYQNNGYFVEFVDQSKYADFNLPATGQTMPEGTSIRLTAQFTLNLVNSLYTPPSDAMLGLYFYPRLLFSIVNADDDTIVFESSQTLKPDSGTNISVNISCNTILPTGGKYVARISFVNSTTPSGTEVNNQSMYIGLQGEMAISTNSQTILAKNGFASVWGQNLLFVNNDSIIMRSGFNGLRISGNGIEQTTDGENWDSVNW